MWGWVGAGAGRLGRETAYGKRGGMVGMLLSASCSVLAGFLDTTSFPRLLDTTSSSPPPPLLPTPERA